MPLRKDFIFSTTNVISKLCYLLYRKTDKTSLGFCFLDRAGFNGKHVISSSGEIECPNLTKVTIVINEIPNLKPYAFHYLTFDQELIIALNSTKLTKAFLKSLTCLNNKSKLYAEEELFIFYLELVKVLTLVTQSKYLAETNVNYEIACKNLWVKGSPTVVPSIVGKKIIIHDLSLKKEDSSK